jgi:hypothetical protein
VPAPLKPFVNVSQLANLNGNTSAVNVKGALLHLGPAAALLFKQLAVNVKGSFVSSITLSFTIGMFMMLAAFVVALFLREIPLRGRGGKSQPSDGAEDEVGETEPEPLPEPVF